MCCRDIEEHATGTRVLSVHRPWASQPARIDYLKLIGAVSDRHVEIMRDDLSEIYYDASRDDVEYVFGDEITAITEDGGVTFEHGPARRFDIDRRRRRTAFRSAAGSSSATTCQNDSSAATSQWCPCRNRLPATVKWTATSNPTGSRWSTPPTTSTTRGRCSCSGHGRSWTTTTGTCHARRTSCVRLSAGMLRTGGAAGLQEVEHTPTFYFDAITQLELTSWSRGRVTLVGDAGYCPGPAVGGSTSLAVVRRLCACRRDRQVGR